MKIGVARVELSPSKPGPPSGWSFAGPAAVAPSRAFVDQLFATVVAIGDGDREVVLVFADLHGGGGALWRLVARFAGVAPERLILAGTHTHQGPGRYYGNAYFDSFAAPGRVPTPWPREAAELARRIAAGVDEARRGATRGSLRIGEVMAEGTGSNRAFAAYLRNPEPERARFGPDPERARDARVTAIVVEVGGRIAAVLGVQAVHGTALGPGWATFSADHAGEARRVAEAELGVPVGIACGAAGDVSPLSVDTLSRITAGRPPQGRELAREVGERIGRALVSAARESAPITDEMALATVLWDTRDEPDLAPPAPGLATAGGGVDGTSPHHLRVGEGVSASGYRAADAWPSGHPQHPKVPIQFALSAAQLLPVTAVSPHILPRVLPVSILRLGTWTWVTVPGEATTMVGARLERAIASLGGDQTRILGYAQEYAGYWTTPEEYDLQRYEAASTLYGRMSSVALERQIVRIAQGM